MLLEYESRPKAGQKFTVAALDFQGFVTIKSILGSELVSLKECEDPPCHEWYIIPHTAAGEILEVIAEDSSGEMKSISFTVE